MKLLFLGTDLQVLRNPLQYLFFAFILFSILFLRNSFLSPKIFVPITSGNQLEGATSYSRRYKIFSILLVSKTKSFAPYKGDSCHVCMQKRVDVVSRYFVHL